MSNNKPNTDQLVNVAVVGLGHWGPNLVRSIEAHSGARVVCAVETSAERRKLVAEKLPNLTIVESFDDCRKLSEITAVVIATPTETHYQIGMRALEAGYHVLLEKPIAHSS